jgi:hypothetical protein
MLRVGVLIDLFIGRFPYCEPAIVRGRRIDRIYVRCSIDSPLNLSGSLFADEILMVS